ncbi:MAG: chemotaxis protein CheA, partial [Spirochaetia bacterium]|nr:chemotaxis protein CheA [Spirochaetia bacterium]
LSPEEEAKDLPQAGAKSAADPVQEEAGAKSSSSEKADTHLRVPVSLIDSLINLAGETVIARNEMAQKITRVKDTGLDMIGKRMSQLITRMQEGIMRTRLQELNIVFQRLPRLVRDVSRVTGKQAELVISGGEVELDKSMIDAIGDSMMHMIRNAIDHGIEPSEERLRLGKPEKGMVKVSAYLRGGNVVIMIRDDGRGLNSEKIKEKAILHNLISREESANLPPEQILDLIFHPGLSTADKVTSTSGRGVGMDVVRSGIKKHGGNVEVVSEEGKGSTFIASIPQTLSIVSCLLVRSGKSIFALPQQNLKELILVEKDKVEEVEEHKVYQLRGHLLPLVELNHMLDIQSDTDDIGEHIAVVHSERHYFGIVVDEVVNLEEIVIKRLGEHFQDLTFFAGAAIMGDGEAILVLDVPGIAKHTNLQASSMEQEMESYDEDEDMGYLVFEAASQSFAVPVATVPRIEKIGDTIIEDFMGREVVKYRDEVVPVIRLESVYELEDAKKARGEYYLIIFNVNGVRSGIVADEIHNVVRDLPNLDTKKFIGDSVIGHSILNGETTLIIDAVDLIKTLMKSRYRDINKIVISEATEVLEEV